MPHWRERRCPADDSEHEPGEPPAHPRDVSPWRGIIIGFILLQALMMLLAFCTRAHAQEHMHGDKVIAGERGKFYETWMRPDNRNYSCCNKQDCDYADAEFKDGHWYAKHLGEEGPRTLVPSSAVDKDRDAPDGAAHLCKRSTWPNVMVYCFVAPAGS